MSTCIQGEDTSIPPGQEEMGIAFCCQSWIDSCGDLLLILHIDGSQNEKSPRRRAVMLRKLRLSVAARKWLTLFLFEVLRRRRAAASAAFVWIGIAHLVAPHKKARTRRAMAIGWRDL
ncbi:hypothetical protein P608_24550 [Comamonas thiooxydans]|uniref:Uncharacterized protein n=1 Tax=Comamonas thiooxydans TaxID=363952 RepID=A0A0E3BMN0_9BURK|nr:hypothetical protein P608_24550 [Comamonas thiooxydans]KGH10049.1 hypothetical protein P607_26785 [Comamonas thiooxydans]KGH18293.1 hypothetical protein P606_25050 [Comamonas thiooxydans]